MSKPIYAAILILVFFFLQSCMNFGCTDPEASNFDPKASIDNSTCVYRIAPVAIISSPIEQAEYNDDQFNVLVDIEDDRGLKVVSISAMMPLGTTIAKSSLYEEFPDSELSATLEFTIDIDHDETWEFKHLGWYTLEFYLQDRDGNDTTVVDSIILLDTQGPEVDFVDFFEEVHPKGSIYANTACSDLSGIKSIEIQGWALDVNDSLKSMFDSQKIEYTGKPQIMESDAGSFNDHGLRDGDRFQIVVIATDYLGNQKSTRSEKGVIKN